MVKFAVYEANIKEKNIVINWNKHFPSFVFGDVIAAPDENPTIPKLNKFKVSVDYEIFSGKSSSFIFLSANY